MKKTVWIIITLAMLFNPLYAAAMDGFYEKADAFFKKYVYQNGVDYAAIQQNPTELNALLTMIEDYDIKAERNPMARKAFWINAYNLLAIKSVVTHFPMHSPLDVEGFFSEAEHRVTGEMLTLDDIEQKKIRMQFNDARTHFALVCAARGCPSIIPEAYTPRKIEEQLESRGVQTVNDETYVRVDSATKTLYLSEIFKWYESDFELGGYTVIQYINRYRSKNKVNENLKIEYIPYDWDLNNADNPNIPK